MNIRKNILEIGTDSFIKACYICSIFSHAGNVFAEAPVKAKHLIVDLYGSTNLALPEPLANFLDPLPIAGIRGKQLAHRTAPNHLAVSRAEIPHIIIDRGLTLNLRKDKSRATRLQKRFSLSKQYCKHILEIITKNPNSRLCG